jgi:hypothetical protein
LLNAKGFSDKGGAGMGLIEMAKKTGNKLDFDFVSLDSDYSYFVLSKTIDADGVGVHHGGEEKAFHGKTVSLLEKLMAENNIYLLWCGHISPDVGKEVLSITETKLSDEVVESKLRKRVFSILVEILENLSKYSPGKEPERQYGMPVVMIKLVDKVYSLTTGNIILNAQVGHLKEKLDAINNYDKTGLKEFFIKSLMRQEINSDSTGNMGLIDMARKSGSKLDYQFERINELYSYYILTVKVKDRAS